MREVNCGDIYERAITHAKGLAAEPATLAYAPIAEPEPSPIAVVDSSPSGARPSFRRGTNFDSSAVLEHFARARRRAA